MEIPSLHPTQHAVQRQTWIIGFRIFAMQSSQSVVLVSRISQFGRVAAAEGTTFSIKFFLKSQPPQLATTDCRVWWKSYPWRHPRWSHSRKFQDCRGGRHHRRAQPQFSGVQLANKRVLLSSLGVSSAAATSRLHTCYTWPGAGDCWPPPRSPIAPPYFRFRLSLGSH